MLQRVKTLEIRGRRLKAGYYYLGCRGHIYGCAQFGDAFAINSEAEWNALRSQHCIDASELPYKHTWGLPIESVWRMARPVPFVHPRGAIGIVKYRAA